MAGPRSNSTLPSCNSGQSPSSHATETQHPIRRALASTLPNIRSGSLRLVGTIEVWKTDSTSSVVSTASERGSEHGFEMASWLIPQMGSEAQPYPTASEPAVSFTLPAHDDCEGVTGNATRGPPIKAKATAGVLVKLQAVWSANGQAPHDLAFQLRRGCCK